jgi:hypothetical protein
MFQGYLERGFVAEDDDVVRADSAARTCAPALRRFREGNGSQLAEELSLATVSGKQINYEYSLNYQPADHTHSTGQS